MSEVTQYPVDDPEYMMPQDAAKLRATKVAAPFFGQPIPEKPFIEEPPSPCPTCGYEPVGVSCGGVTWVACQTCRVQTDECDDPEDAWDLWEARAVHP